MQSKILFLQPETAPEAEKVNPGSPQSSPRLAQALQHLSLAPGKQIRARLLAAAAHSLGSGTPDAKDTSAAQAIELIHSYSLVHDDLPAMDDDDLRRGQPTLHVAFDEATAILVGDGLQARAFELIATDMSLSAQQRVELIACLAKAAGFDGMVGGQSLDMEATEQLLTLEELRHLHSLKTGALITAALEMGGIVGGADDKQRETLRAFGAAIGLAFQVVDDIIDVESDSATLGKTQGKDAQSGKATYVSLLGIEGARAEAARLREEALALIESWGESAEPLRELVSAIVDRDR
jgi:geranylgeranyl pyrophosphate synthase